MKAELAAFDANNTWDITDLPPGKNAVGSKWIFQLKESWMAL
ncbi:unnamed protein product [Rhodiola kirilowii]